MVPGSGIAAVKAGKSKGLQRESATMDNGQVLRQHAEWQVKKNSENFALNKKSIQSGCYILIIKSRAATSATCISQLRR